MNSSQSSLQNDELEANSCDDTNANVNDTSKGAIPKRPKVSVSKKASLKKAVKLNNNIENMSTLNIEEPPKLSSVNNGLASCYMEEFIEPSCSSHTTCFFDSKDECNSTDSTDLTGSSDETDLLSVSEDGCIYTYKGDQVADLPNSFFELPPDIPENRENDASSPEMDYLEMDFDPSNNGDVDSSDVDVNETNALDVSNVELSNSNVESNSLSNETEEPLSSSPSVRNNQVEEDTAIVNQLDAETNDQRAQNVEVEALNHNSNNSNNERCECPQEEEQKVENMPWSCTLENRTISLNFRVTKRLHITRGDLVSPSENVPQIRGAKVQNQTEPIDSSEKSGVEDAECCMIWTQEEAYLKQITQIGPSSCGATAVLNVLKALRLPVPDASKITDCVRTQLRQNEAPLAEYLLSRSTAGSTHKDLIDGLQKVSNGDVYARFFHMYPERVVNLCTWLKFWIRNGAVPIATLNLQRCLGTVPDAWHHQMIYGVDANGIYLTNPLERVEAGLLWPQLCSESVLLVRRGDVISRWNVNRDLAELMRISDCRWQRINVVGQVANMIHESSRALRSGFTNTSHIRIPAAYSSGITLAASINTPAFTLLKQSPELPLLDPHDAASCIYYS